MRLFIVAISVLDCFIVVAAFETASIWVISLLRAVKLALLPARRATAPRSLTTSLARSCREIKEEGRQGRGRCLVNK